MSHPLDIVLFGATGYTGRYIIASLERLTKINNYKWGIAGRNRIKLEKVLAETSEKLGKDLSAIPIILAEINDEESLINMTSKARLVINACGPYRFFGEPVIKACIQTGTHHIDVTGEPEYMEKMQLLYHEEAKNKGIYIISSCGFDSIPADLGLLFFKNNFEKFGTLHSVEIFMKTSNEENDLGSAVNYATWESAVHGFANYKELIKIRSKLFPNRLPQYDPKLKERGIWNKNEVTKTWCIPFPGADRSVILRTQRYLYEKLNRRPIQVQTYFCIESLSTLLTLPIISIIFYQLTRSEYGRSLLMKYPEFFSMGMVSHEAPPEIKMQNTKIVMTFVGLGWNKQTENCDGKYKMKPNKKMVMKISGKNPAYGLTAAIVSWVAITVLNEKDNLPDKGGVYSPGAAFLNTSLINNLTKTGLNVEFESVKDILTNKL